MLSTSNWCSFIESVLWDLGNVSTQVKGKEMNASEWKWKEWNEMTSKEMKGRSIMKMKGHGRKRIERTWKDWQQTQTLIVKRWNSFFTLQSVQLYDWPFLAPVGYPLPNWFEAWFDWLFNYLSFRIWWMCQLKWNERKGKEYKEWKSKERTWMDMQGNGKNGNAWKYSKIRRPESACSSNNLMQNPNRSQNPKSKIQNPKSKIQNPKSKIQDPKSKIQTAAFGAATKRTDTTTIQNPKSKIQDPKSKIQNPKSEIRNPKSKIQNPKSKIQNPKSEIQNPKSKIQDPKSKLQNPNGPFGFWILEFGFGWPG